MKKQIALCLATAMLATSTMTVFASTLEYPVKGISQVGYAYDESTDSVDISSPIETINYGGSVYYPLLNNGNDNVSKELNALLEEKKTIMAQYDTLTKAVDTKKASSLAINEQLAMIKEIDLLVKELNELTITDVNVVKQKISTLMTSLKLTMNPTYSENYELVYALKPIPAKPEIKDTDISDLKQIVADWEINKGDATKNEEYKNLYQIAIAKLGVVSTVDTPELASEEALKLLPQKATVAITEENINALKGFLTEWDNANNMQSTIAEKETALNGLINAYNTKYNTTISKTSNFNDIINSLNTQKTDADNALKTAENNKTNYYNTNVLVINDKITKKEAEIAKNDYKFVNESKSIERYKIRNKITSNKALIKDIKIEKFKFTPNSLTGNKRYAYFLVITLNNSSSLSNKDILGTLEISKTGSDSFNVDLEVALQIEHGRPSSTLEIPNEEALFIPKEDFEADGVEEFSFECDSDSWFEVNTRYQEKLVLGMNNKFNKDIYTKYEKANLEFWNGNGATFFKTGSLYLYTETGKYVYEADGKTLKAVTFTKDGDHLVIKTRELGKYVISDIKLDTSIVINNNSSSNNDNSDSNNDDYNPNKPNNPYYNPNTGGPQKHNPNTGVWA